MTRNVPPGRDDEAFLDLLFNQIVELIEEGNAPRAVELAAERPHLRPRVEELIRLAHRIKPDAGQPLPEIPGYTVLRELGSGGMGAVYLARQERLGGRPVALKLLPAAMALSARARERFRNEAHAIARLSHPNIVAVHDVVAVDGLHAYAMEWVDGQSLSDWIAARRDGHTDVVFVCRVGIAVARALHAVHAAGLLHRDVKPSNILLRRDGTPLLTDFGLARETDATLTQAGHFAGTVAYSPPEQLRGETEKLDARSDVYSLAVTLYHLLALRLPFRAERPEGVLQQIERGAASALRKVAPRVPVDLQTILATAMDPDLGRRYASAAELADDLERLLNLQPIKARPAGLITRTLKLARRKRGLLAAGSAGAALTAAVLVALGVYLFLVPDWVAEHVCEARLALLDPEQANYIQIGTLSESPSTEWSLPPRIRSQALQIALSHYDAALRLSPFDGQLRREREAVARVETELRVSRNPAVFPAARSSFVTGDYPNDLRLNGLHAFLLGDTDAALVAWSQFEAAHDSSKLPDPLVTAALGLLYIAREQPACAYPRLRDAVQAFPNVGFLRLYLADAAVQCGDLNAAERLLRDAAGFSLKGLYDGMARVQADLLAKTGVDSEAERLYRKAAIGNSVAELHYAVFLESRNRQTEALVLYRNVSRAMPAGRKAQRAFLAAADRWWNSLSTEQRQTEIRRAIQDRGEAAGSFIGLLRDYALALKAIEGRPDERRGPPAVARRDEQDRFLGPMSPKRRDFTTLGAVNSALPLKSLSLGGLARRLEVTDMSLSQNRDTC